MGQKEGVFYTTKHTQPMRLGIDSGAKWVCLHDMSLDAKRVMQNAKVEDLTLLYHQTIYAERVA